MTITQLEYIISLDQYRHFVTAADKMNVTQPTLSMQVKKLETELNVKIFDRDKSPLKPTEAGEKIIEKAKEILKDVEQLKNYVKFETGVIEGKYKVGIIPSIAPYLLPIFMTSFSKNYPNISLTIEEEYTSTIIEKLKNGFLDLAIMSTPIYDSSLKEFPIYKEPLVVYFSHMLLSNTLNVTPEALESENLILLNKKHCLRQQILNASKNKATGKIKNFSYECNSVEGAKKLVKNNLGYTIVPELSVFGNIEDMRNIKRFQRPEPSREISIVTSKSFVKDSLIEILRKSIIERLPRHFLNGQDYKIIKWN